MDDTIYFIGNGTRSKKQLEYLEDKVTFACNMAPMEWYEWPFIPVYWSSTEDPTYKDNFFRRIEEASKAPGWHYVKKILPDFCDKSIPNTKFYPIESFDISKMTAPKNKIIRFGCTGSVSSGICLSQLKFKHVVIIGCDSYRKDVEDCPTPVHPVHKILREQSPWAFLKKQNDRHMRGWRRLALWRDKFFPESLILNASEDSKIDCFPKIKLGDEIDIIDYGDPIPPIPESRYKCTH